MVQQGTIEFKFDGEVHPLYKGDCLYFESHVSHRIINAQKQEATVLCVLFEPGH
ncbi:MAG: cupin domain-containing protein [Planctomycetaceae bacterium]|nr:cupin domain-containing protein [Planctomycetaceae bacterium]